MAEKESNCRREAGRQQDGLGRDDCDEIALQPRDADGPARAVLPVPAVELRDAGTGVAGATLREPLRGAQVEILWLNRNTQLAHAGILPCTPLHWRDATAARPAPLFTAARGGHGCVHCLPIEETPAHLTGAAVPSSDERRQDPAAASSAPLTRAHPTTAQPNGLGLF